MNETFLELQHTFRRQSAVVELAGSVVREFDAHHLTDANASNTAAPATECTANASGLLAPSELRQRVCPLNYTDRFTLIAREC